MMSKKIGYWSLFLCLCLEAKKDVDYNQTPIIPGKIVLTPQTITSLPTLTSEQRAGYLDKTFGSNGSGVNVLAHIAGGTKDAIGGFDGSVLQGGLALLPEGAIIAGGTSQDGIGTYHFSLAKLLPSGILDITFGGSPSPAPAGTTYLAHTIAGGVTDKNLSIAVQPDGKIVAAGYTAGGGHIYMAVARFLSDGTPDVTFGGFPTPAPAGTTYLPNIAGGIEDNACSVTIQSDGKIVVAGYSKDATPLKYCAVARLLSDGNLDTTFGGFPAPAPAGTTYIPSVIVGSNDQIHNIILQPDGKFVAVGVALDAGTNRFIIMRLLSNGALDTTFGGFPAPAAAGITYLPTFEGVGYSVHTISEGKLFCAGLNQTISTYVAMRLLSSGALDTTFGQDGLTTIAAMNVFGVTSLAFDSVLQPDGSLILGGFTSDGGAGNFFSLARIFSNGLVDTTFGGFLPLANTGSSYVPAATLSGWSTALKIQSDGKIVLAGYQISAGPEYKFAFARFTNNYTLATYQDEYPNQGGFY